MSRLEKLARGVVAELGHAHWYPGYTTKDKPPPQPRSVELLRRYLMILDASRMPKLSDERVGQIMKEMR